MNAATRRSDRVVDSNTEGGPGMNAATLSPNRDVVDFIKTEEPTSALKVEKRRLDTLHPHPKQASQFGDLPEHELRRLANRMRRDGLERPVEITPDDIIIAGHQRVRAAELLGWTEIDVIVREDLVLQGEAAVERRFLEDNDRRQLTPLQKARLVKARWDLGQHAGFQDSGEDRRGSLRDRIGQELGMSGRNLDRYLRVLETPFEVQQALDANKLTLNDVARVAGLLPQYQQAVADAIRGGQDPGTAVAHYLPKKSGRHETARTARHSFVQALSRGMDDLEGRIPDVTKIPDDEVAVLKEGYDLIRRILGLPSDEPALPVAANKKPRQAKQTAPANQDAKKAASAPSTQIPRQEASRVRKVKANKAPTFFGD